MDFPDETLFFFFYLQPAFLHPDFNLSFLTVLWWLIRSLETWCVHLGGPPSPAIPPHPPSHEFELLPHSHTCTGLHSPPLPTSPALFLSPFGFACQLPSGGDPSPFYLACSRADVFLYF